MIKLFLLSVSLIRLLNFSDSENTVAIQNGIKITVNITHIFSSVKLCTNKANLLLLCNMGYYDTPSCL